MFPLSAALAAAAVAFAVAASPPAEAGVTVTRDVPYGPAPLTLDLYEPAADSPPADAATGAAIDVVAAPDEHGGDPAAPRPAVVWVHGGGWTSGDKGMPSARSYATELAERGFVTLSIDYRLLARGGCPQAPGCDTAVLAATRDVTRAVRWVRAHHERLGVDPRRIAVAGSSAGAITSLLVASSPAPGAEVNAVVSLSGGLPREWRPSPRSAPALLFHGTADTRLPMTWSQRAVQLLRAAGGAARLRLVPEAGHDLWPLHAPPAVRQMTAFLRAAPALPARARLARRRA